MGNTIYSTTEYDLFDVDTNKLKGNRTLSESHVRQLQTSISENATSIEFTPIIVNEKNQVIDGQHRLKALQRLGLPVHYIVWEGGTLEDAQRLNASSKNWTPLDYAYSYASRGNKHYKTYLEFRELYGLNHDILVQYLGLRKPMTSMMFKTGKLKVDDVAASHQLCSELLDLGDYYVGCRRRSFALAFKNIWAVPFGKYDHKHMLEQARKYGSRFFQDYPGQEENKRMIEKIYNYGSSQKTRLS